MKLKKKSVLVLIVGILMSMSAMTFLNSESKQSARLVLPSVEQEKLEHSIPAVDPAKLVKYMFEALIKLVPQS